MTPKIEGLLFDLCAKIGTTSEHLWEVMIRQAYINGMAHLSIAIIMLIIMSALFVAATKSARKVYTDAFDNEVVGIWATFGIIFSIAVIIMLFESNNLIITPLLNPEYSAAKMIMEAIR